MSFTQISNHVQFSLYANYFKAKHRVCASDFTRERTLTFPIVAAHLLNSSKKSLQIECNLLGELLNHEPVSKQALSLARYKLAPSAFFELHSDVVRLHYTENTKGLWNGYRIFGGDGSLVELPDTTDIETNFGRCYGKPIKARVFQYTEISSDIPVSAVISPFAVGERKLAKLRLNEVVTSMRSYGQHKQLYLYDRGFPSHDFAKQHLDEQVDFLFRLPRQFNPTIDKLLCDGKEHDTIIEFTRSDGNYSARIIITYLSSGNPEMLMTSLVSKEQYSAISLVELYHLRWRCEESYKFQKMLLELENFSGRTTHCVLLEFWATVLLTAMFAIYCQEQEEKNAQSQNGNQQRKINRRVVYASIRRTMLQALMKEIPMKVFEDQFKKLAKRHTVPIRPGRSFERAPPDRHKRRHIYRRAL